MLDDNILRNKTKDLIGDICSNYTLYVMNPQVKSYKTEIRMP